MSSAFHCSCGHEFSAADVHGAIDRLLDMCRRLVNILENRARANDYFTTRSQASLRGFVASCLGSLGEAAGFVIGKLLGKLLI